MRAPTKIVKRPLKTNNRKPLVMEPEWCPKDWPPVGNVKVKDVWRYILPPPPIYYEIDGEVKELVAILQSSDPEQVLVFPYPAG